MGGPGTFLDSEELCGFWEIVEEEKRGDGYGDCEKAFEDEAGGISNALCA
jgi:hypothetical protein